MLFMSLTLLVSHEFSGWLKTSVSSEFEEDEPDINESIRVFTDSLLNGTLKVRMKTVKEESSGTIIIAFVIGIKLLAQGPAGRTDSIEIETRMLLDGVEQCRPAAAVAPRIEVDQAATLQPGGHQRPAFHLA